MSTSPSGLLVRAALPIALVLASSGCMGTKIKNVWSDPELEKDRYGRVMVLVVANNHARRETAEDRLHAVLTRDGVDAIRSYDSIPGHAFEDRERIRKAVEASGADALLAVVVTHVGREQEVQEGREQWVPNGRGVDYYGYVTTSYGLYRTPEVYDYLSMEIETSLWDAQTKKVVWAARSLTESGKDTITASDVTDEYADVVVKKVRPYLKAK